MFFPNLDMELGMKRQYLWNVLHKPVAPLSKEAQCKTEGWVELIGWLHPLRPAAALLKTIACNN